MRIVIDLDGTICTLKQEGETYADVSPLPGAKEKLETLKSNGHYLIIYTARHMKTCDGNIERVIEKMEGVTREWLEKHAIPYDELVFGKPFGHLYIDDLAHPFTSWEDEELEGKITRDDKNHDS